MMLTRSCPSKPGRWVTSHCSVLFDEVGQPLSTTLVLLTQAYASSTSPYLVGVCNVFEAEYAVSRSPGY